MAVRRAMPHMTVAAPADGVETRLAMRAANAWDGPVYLRLTRDLSPVILPPVYAFAIGRAVVLRQESDVALISSAVQTIRCLQAADLLEAQGISAHLLHVRWRSWPCMA